MKLIKPMIHPTCFEDESPVGYLHRLATINHYDSYDWLILDNRRCKTIHEIFDLLTENPWTGFSKNHRFNSINELSYLYLQTANIKICPQCLEQDQYWDYKSHATLSPVCIKHQCWKIDFCSDCKARFLWRLGSLQFCQCLAKRRKGTVKVPQNILQLSAFIDDNQEGYTSNWISNEFSYKARCDLFLLFARSINLYGRYSLFPRLTTIDGAKEFWEKIANIMADENFEFKQFISKLYRYNKEHFKEFYRRFQEFDQPSLSQHRDQLINFITQDLKVSITKQHRSLVRDRPESGIWLPLQTASRKFKIPKSRLLQLIENGKIEHDRRVEKNRVMTLLYIRLPDEFKEHVEKYINFKNATIQLGVTKSQLASLIQRDFLVDVCKPEIHFSRWQISKEEIESLKLKLIENIKPSSYCQLTISDALAFYSKGSDDLLPQIIKAILQKELTVTNCLDGSYIRDIFLDKNEFLIWRKKLLEVTGKISIVNLAKRFEISQESMYQIVNAGLIKTENMGKANLNRMILEEEVSRFKNTYVLLSKIAWALRKQPRQLKEHFRECEVKPIDEVLGIELRQNIYLRSELLSKCNSLGYLLEKKGDWTFEKNEI